MNNDLISRKALLERIREDAPWWWQNFHSFFIVDMIKDVHGCGAEPVQHGEWILNPCNLYNDATWVCSVCENEWVLIDGTPLDNQMNYCPKCGARMDGEIDDDHRYDHQ